MRERTITGTITDSDDPVWDPLVALVGGHHAVWFMWMYEVELSDGSKIHCYKHCSTRRSMHLGVDGRAWAYIGEHRYRRIDPEIVVDAVLAGWVPEDDP